MLNRHMRRFHFVVALAVAYAIVFAFVAVAGGAQGSGATLATTQNGVQAPAATAPPHDVQVPYTANAQTGSTSLAPASAEPQTPSAPASAAESNAPIVTSQSNLVLVPVLVKTKANEVVFSLTAGDFQLSDDGVQQSVRVEQDTNLEPLALAVIVETGGEGASHLGDYRDLGAVLDAVIGDVPHRVAVIGFDSVPHLEQDFTANTDAAAETIAGLHKGDQGAAILDALTYGIKLLSKQPPEYRRAVLLLSETEDGGSQTSMGDAIRAVDDTNTSIYSFGFSTRQEAVKHEASKLPVPGGTTYGNTPYAPGGCMSRDSDPDAHGSRGVQALDCASDLLPPIRLGRMAFLEAWDGLRRNVPESVAQLTGGEYFDFENARTLGEDMVNASNDLPNYYILSFRPQAPHEGMHTLQLRVKDRPKLQLKARRAYWVDE
ncbi:MAG TPA: VWA domain-containing protein [Candidatus Aquilonibacter sp.]|nr:VWA domain-containing protein [Candidatus Aquilonibacter sp.]